MTVRRFIVNSSDSFKACVSVRFSFRFRKHQRLLLRTVSLPSALMSLRASPARLSRALLKCLRDVKAVYNVHGRGEPLA